MIKGISLAAALGAAMFSFVFAVAVGDDLRRNWNTDVRDIRTIQWNPLLVWKVLLFAGSIMFLLFTWLSYRQEENVGLSASFAGFAVFCFVVAKKWL